MNTAHAELSWSGIVRLGSVQAALGAVVVLTTSTLNRVMIVELSLPAMLPGLLVALHYAVQMVRPRLGYGADRGGRCTPWIVGGIAVLSLGGIAASVGTALMSVNVYSGIAIAVIAFLMIGLGVGAAGTSLLVLLAKHVSEGRRPAAATLMWIMMIAGFVITTGLAGHFLDPFTPARLVIVTTVVAVTAFLVTVLAVWNVESARADAPLMNRSEDVSGSDFRRALAQVWHEPQARRFTVFVFVSMLAYSAQDLILEPFAGLVFGMSPGASTQLSSLQNGGALAGMIFVALLGQWSAKRGRRFSLRRWTIAGCLGSAVALLGISGAGWFVADGALRAAVVALGFSNGIFTIAAIGSMMELAGVGHSRREGVRMGLWGAAQAIAFAVGGFTGAVGVDAARLVFVSPTLAYLTIFVFDSLLFLLAARLAASIAHRRAKTSTDAEEFPRIAIEPDFAPRVSQP